MLKLDQLCHEERIRSTLSPRPPNSLTMWKGSVCLFRTNLLYVCVNATSVNSGSACRFRTNLKSRGLYISSAFASCIHIDIQHRFNGVKTFNTSSKFAITLAIKEASWKTTSVYNLITNHANEFWKCFMELIFQLQVVPLLVYYLLLRPFSKTIQHIEPSFKSTFKTIQQHSKQFNKSKPFNTFNNYSKPSITHSDLPHQFLHCNLSARKSHLRCCRKLPLCRQVIVVIENWPLVPSKAIYWPCRGLMARDPRHWWLLGIAFSLAGNRLPVAETCKGPEASTELPNKALTWHHSSFGPKDIVSFSDLVEGCALSVHTIFCIRYVGQYKSEFVNMVIYS